MVAQSYPVAVRSRSDTFVIVKQFLRTMYSLPSAYQLTLDDKPWSPAYISAPDYVHFRLEEFCHAPPPPPKTATIDSPQRCSVYYPERPPLLEGHLDLSPSGDVTNYDGGFHEYEKKIVAIQLHAEDLLYAQFQKNYEEHDRLLGERLKNNLPLYTKETELKEARFDEADVLQELKDAGAKFTPDKKEEFLELFRKQRLDQFFGKSRVKSVRFVFQHLNSSSSGAILRWVVDLEVRRSNGRLTNHVLFYEPFEGTLDKIRPKE